MPYRRRESRKTRNRTFKRAGRTHNRNIPRNPMRGGIRL